MPALRGASGVVIRCFKAVEHCADTLTGAAGPVFIALAWLLTGTIGFAFFDVVARQLSWTATLLLVPLYILIPGNLYIHYWLVTHVPPGYPGATSARDTRWMIPNPRGLLAPERWGFRPRGTPPAQPLRPSRMRRCRKCNGPKPERAHHCSVCNRCVLLMDHHCPWINACVGLHNQRHFVLFMMWLAVGAAVVVVLGWSHAWASLEFFTPWDAYTPKVIFTLAYILSIACGSAVLVLGSWHMFMVARGETSIESHDNDYMDKKAKAEGLIYLNPYDLGRRRNLENFFNVGPGGYSKLTLLFPLVVPPYTSGWAYPRRSLPTRAPDEAPLLQHGEDRGPPLTAGGDRDVYGGVGAGDAHMAGGPGAHERLVGDGPGGMYIMGGGDELTDDESGGGGWWGDEGDELAAGGNRQR